MKSGNMTTCCCFNTQPPEGGWSAGRQASKRLSGFNTQPPEGGCLRHHGFGLGGAVSTHSRLKAAVQSIQNNFRNYLVSTHSRLKAADPQSGGYTMDAKFQHTAA